MAQVAEEFDLTATRSGSGSDGRPRRVVHAEARRPVSWLPGPPPDLPLKGRRWRPDAIGTISTARLRYVVVDELFADTAELSISSWPVVDPLGRLRFPDEPTAHVEVDARRMQTFLRRNRMPRKAVGRVLRAGDTFGITVRARELAAFLKVHESSETPERERARMLDPKTWEWLEPTIFDITSQAKEAAKLSYYAALTGPLPGAEPRGAVTLPAPSRRPVPARRLRGRRGLERRSSTSC